MHRRRNVRAPACLLSAGAVLLAARAQAAEGEIPLRTMMEAQPMRVEDAYPMTEGTQGRVAVATSDPEGRPGIFVQPRVAVGFPTGQEFEVSWTGGTEFDAERTGPMRFHGQTLLLRERGALPTVSISAALVTPERDEGVAGEFAAQASKMFGKSAAHLNLGYRLQQDGPDRAIVGLGADHELNDRFMALAGGYYERFFSDENLFVVQAGASARVAKGLLMQLALGVDHFEGESRPNVLLGVVGTL